MHRLLVSALLVGVPACVSMSACAYRSGNDESLRPVVRRGPKSSGTFSIKSKSGTQVAVLEAVSSSVGWSLYFLGAADSLGTLSYTAPARMVALGPVTPIGGTRMYYYGMNSLCAMGLPLPPDKNGMVFLSYDWGCSQFLEDLTIPPAPATQSRAPSPAPDYVYVLVAASTAHLSNQQWKALADSVHVHILASAPGALGHLAFEGDPSIRWEVALRELALLPTAGSDSTGPQTGIRFKTMAAAR